MGKALYRKYRSRSLDEIVGQEHVTTLLSRAIELDRVAHAYLFTGPRGVGKTSIARILAYAINKIDYVNDSTQLDIIEIDAASNNGVDDMRDLREKARIAPSLSEKKIYIIDEVHMLSKPAFNALLKTLEEPPEHVVFILATTDIDKVPETIISRTQRYTFRRASESQIIDNLKRIAKSEKVKVDAEALGLIAHYSDGSFRDSVSLFDQLLSLSDETTGLTKDVVIQTLGLAPEDGVKLLIDAAANADIATISRTLNQLFDDGTPAKIISEQLILTLQEKIVIQPDLIPLLDSLLGISKTEHPHLKLLTVLSRFRTVEEVAVTPAQAVVKQAEATKPVTKKALTDETETAIQNAIDNEQKVATTQNKTTEKKQPTAEIKSFDWDGLLAHTRANYIALNSVLAKCGYKIDGTKLVIFARSKFYKTKLDSAKYLAQIHQSLEELGIKDIEIETRPESAPLKDSSAARVAAMMGGGEEVNIDE